MRLNQQLIGMSFGILVLSLVGRWLLRSARFGRLGRGRNSGGVAAALGIGLALMVIGAIGMLLSRIIKAAVSRERERLADASAVQFTREPSGLAGALTKIGEHSGELKSVETEEIAHMLFTRGSWSFRGLFATHPPLLERIGALDASLARRMTTRAARAPEGAGAEHGTRAVSASAAFGAAGLVTGASSTAAADAVGDPLARAGTVDKPEVGGALLAQLPEEVVHAAHSREASFLLVLALALADDETERTRQLALLESQIGATRLSRCRRLWDDLSGLDPLLKLPMLEIAVPALKQRPTAELDYLFELLERLAAVDPKPRLFEWVLVRVLAAYLGRETAAAQHAKARALTDRAALAATLATVAAFGHDDAQAAAAAYRAGWAALGSADKKLGDAADGLPAGRDLDALDTALGRLTALKPTGKRKVLTAVLATIRHDRTVTLAEMELFRAIAAVLDCPLPPGAAAANARTETRAAARA
jgi:hypothetical protein